MPVPTTTSCPARAAGDGAGTGRTLPWWSLLPSVLAFVTLLLLVADPAADGGPDIGVLVTRLADMAGR
ncbi:hypothetical protein [Streptomyces sp. NPDC002644]